MQLCQGPGAEARRSWWSVDALEQDLCHMGAKDKAVSHSAPEKAEWVSMWGASPTPGG